MSDQCVFCEILRGNEPASFTYHAWDETAGTAGGTADATVTGAASAFSTASDVVTLAVSPLDDAPVVGAPAKLASIATYYECVPGFERLLADEDGDLPRFYAAARSLTS